jgi:predicted HNH restriction endonuclease
MNDNLIVKETDNFFLKKYQAVLPEEAYWFFEIPKQIENNTCAIQVGYENHNYTVFFKQSETSAQIQMIWTSALSEVLEQYMLEKACYPYCAFKRTGEKQYEMMLMPGERKRFQEPLDDGHSDEEIEEHARTIDTESLTEIVRHRANLHPSSKDITIQQIVRDKYIAEYAKRRAKGVCQLCMQPAPFKKNDGEPYLESHHIIWLSRGGADSGENVVALCPNCHRKMHIVDDQGDIQKLKEIIEHIDK